VVVSPSALELRRQTYMPPPAPPLPLDPVGQPVWEAWTVTITPKLVGTESVIEASCSCGLFNSGLYVGPDAIFRVGRAAERHVANWHRNSA
jgi:hypothetical protein